ncbi:MAG: cobalamin-binding protein [Bacillota bacterium]
MRKVLIILAALATLMVLPLISGCGRQQSGGTSGGDSPVTLRDNVNRTVVIKKFPERIVSLAPSNTEIVFALGLEGKLVGVTTYCNFPPEAEKKPKIGGFADPSLEKILAQQPDLVLASDQQGEIVSALENHGIPVLVIAPETVEDIIKNVQLVGRATGATRAAGRLAADLEKRIDAVTSKTCSLPESKKPKVFYELWYEPLMTAGPGTFIDDLITLAGGINIASDARKKYPEYSLEAVLAKNPDVLINSYGHGEGTPTREQVKARKGWQNLNCIKNDRIYTVHADLVNRPGPRIVAGLEAFARAIHPELFR